MPRARGGRGSFCSSAVGGGAMVGAGFVSANTGAVIASAVTASTIFLMTVPSCGGKPDFHVIT
jgi:hypothetical protein